MLLDLTAFALQEQSEDNLMVAFSRAWYNGSYIMAAKPIKSLELHYTMIKFLILNGNRVGRCLLCRKKFFLLLSQKGNFLSIIM